MAEQGSSYTWLGVIAALVVVAGGAVWYTSGTAENPDDPGSSSQAAEAQSAEQTENSADDGGYEFDPSVLTTHPAIWEGWKELTQKQREINERHKEIKEGDPTDQEIAEFRERNRGINRNVTEGITEHFEEAIEAEPDNAHNHMSYAYYLFPRERQQAWDEFERAIRIDQRPEFYCLWAQMISTPTLTGGQVFITNVDNDRIEANAERSLTMLDKAFELDPENGAIPLRKATTAVKLHRRGDRDEPEAEMLYEAVKKGNQAEEFYYCLPPPIPYKIESWQRLWAPWKELGDLARPSSLRGVWTSRDLETTYKRLIEHYRETDNLDALVQANEMLLNATLTKPYDRTYLEMHKRLARSALQAVDEKHPEAVEDSEVTNPKVLYQDARRQLWTRLIELGYRPSDKAKWFDVEAWERNWERDTRLYDFFFPHQRRIHDNLADTLSSVKERLQNGTG